MKSLLDWLPYIGIAIIPGIVNIIAAWQKLNKKCQFLPFFKPHKTLGFWLWLLIQFISPILLFWLFSPFQNKLNIDLVLIFKALALGIGFIVLLNATTEVGNLSVTIKPAYDFFVDIAFQSIASHETERSASFWYDVEKQLNSSTADELKEGLKYLEHYFLCDVSLSEQQKEEKQQQLQKVQSKTVKEEKIKAVKSLITMNVRRENLREVLDKFQVSSDFLNKYSKLKSNK